jgi:hypothetical protein
MPNFYGPSWPRRVDRRAELGPYEPRDEPPFVAQGLTLREALAEYERHFKVHIWPHDGAYPAIPFFAGGEPRYFYYRSADSTDISLVDIHVTRNEEVICPKQDLEFELLPSDFVDIGELIC